MTVWIAGTKQADKTGANASRICDVSVGSLKEAGELRKSRVFGKSSRGAEILKIAGHRIVEILSPTVKLPVFPTRIDRILSLHFAILFAAGL